MRILFSERLNDCFGFGDAQGCLGEIGDLVVLSEGERFDIGDAFDNGNRFSGREGFTDNASAFRVSFVTDVDDRVAVLEEAMHFEVDLVDERTRCINHGAILLPGDFEVFGRRTVRGEDDDGVLGNFFGAVDGDRAARFQILHHGFVVDDFVLDIDRRAENIERILDRLYRARHPRAKPARGGEKDFLDGYLRHMYFFNPLKKNYLTYL